MTKKHLEQELARYKKALELATAAGCSFQYEGWGGRTRSKWLGPESAREHFLKQATEILCARKT